MTEQQREQAAALNQQRETEPLSTTDVAAAQPRSETQAGELKRMEADAMPVETQPSDATSAGTGQPVSSQPAQLLATNETQALRARWDSIQTGFVDEPRHAVEQADTLVAEVMQHLAQLFADERSKLEGQWSRGDNVSTEDLRIALQRYRSFFDRLLSL